MKLLEEEEKTGTKISKIKISCKGRGMFRVCC
jgi:hypothetical protein